MINLLIKIFTAIPLIIDGIKFIVNGIQSIIDYIKKKKHDADVKKAIEKAKTTGDTSDLENQY